jgi:diguanylate cyclase (GGDEF)-like protein
MGTGVRKPDQEAGAQAAARAAGECSRLLLVEDSPSDAGLVVSLLHESRPDIEVTVVRSLTEAVERLSVEHTVAITDLSLPDAQGLECVATLRAERPDLPLVVLTGNHDEALASQALSLGAQDFLDKRWLDPVLLERTLRYAQDRLRADQRARALERYAGSLLDAIESPTCAVDTDATIVATNDAWRSFCSSCGLDAMQSGSGRNYLEVIGRIVGSSAGSAREVADGVHRVLRGKVARFEQDFLCDTPTDRRWFSLRASSMVDGGAVLTHVDVSALKQTHEELEHHALHDLLTGLPNRGLFHDRLAFALDASARTGERIAVFFLDLDGFKKVNDTFGHSVGDAMLVEIAARLQRAVRGSDTAARFGGDEFVVCARVGHSREVEVLGKRLLASLIGSLVLDGGHEIDASVSIGVAVGTAGDDPAALIAAADSAMYEAKKGGRQDVVFATDWLRSPIVDRRSLEADLRAAIDRNEFVLRYQPVLGLQPGKPWGAEALLRWEHPERGLLHPSDFLEVAESTGLIVDIGSWVFAEAAARTAELVRPGQCDFLSVNCSAIQLTDARTIEAMFAALADRRPLPGALQVELTESALVRDEIRAVATMTALTDLGVGLAVDDVGRAYSRTLHLKRFPVDCIKIDSAFVDGMMRSPDDAAIVSCLATLGDRLGYRIVAEGIETEDQRRVLTGLGVTHGQGALFSPAVPASELLATISALRAGDTNGSPPPGGDSPAGWPG